MNQVSKKNRYIKKTIKKGYLPTKDAIKGILKISTNNSIYGWRLFGLNDYIKY